MTTRTDFSLVVALVSTALFYLAVALEVSRWTRRALEDRFVRGELEAWLGPVAAVAGAVWPCVVLYLALDALYRDRARHANRRGKRR